MNSLVADIIEVDTSPFKGPFKGKGANRKAVNCLRSDLEEIIVAMKNVISDYSDLFPAHKRAVRLNVQMQRGIPQLWWREANNTGRFVKIFEDPGYAKYLSEQLPATLESLKRFDRLRLQYNLQATMVGHAIEHYGKFLNGNSLLDEFQLTGND